MSTSLGLALIVTKLRKMMNLSSWPVFGEVIDSVELLENALALIRGGPETLTNFSNGCLMNAFRQIASIVKVWEWHLVGAGWLEGSRT
jgi:hypothetical protein